MKRQKEVDAMMLELCTLRCLGRGDALRERSSFAWRWYGGTWTFDKENRRRRVAEIYSNCRRSGP